MNKSDFLKRAPENKEEIEFLVGTALSKNIVDRQPIIERLATPEIGAKRHVEAVYIGLLDNPDPDIRGAAARACAALKSVQAVPKLRLLLKQAPKKGLVNEKLLGDGEADEYRRSYPIAKALSELGDFESAEEILSREILAMNWESLLPHFGARLLPLVVKRARSGRFANDAVESSARRTIASIQDVSAVPQLIRLLSDRDAKLVSSAAQSLAIIGTPEAIAAAEAAYAKLSDWGKLDFVQICSKRWDISKTVKLADEFIRNESTASSARFLMIQVVGATENKLAIPMLQGILSHPNDSFRAQAACELAKLSGKLHPYQETNQTRRFEKGCPEIQKLREME